MFILCARMSLIMCGLVCAYVSHPATWSESSQGGVSFLRPVEALERLQTALQRHFALRHEPIEADGALTPGERRIHSSLGTAFGSLAASDRIFKLLAVGQLLASQASFSISLS